MIRIDRVSERVIVIVVLCVGLSATEAYAQLMITPFLGATFGTDTVLPDPDVGAAEAKHWIFGGNAAVLSEHILGVEGDFAFAPGFFNRDTALNLVVQSHVSTLFGNVIAAVPLSVTRDSLRPYVLGGLGLVHISVQDQLPLFDRSGNSLGLQMGGGAIGFITNRTGVRFDLRFTKSLDRATDEITQDRGTNLSFWRATVGVAIRY